MDIIKQELEEGDLQSFSFSLFKPSLLFYEFMTPKLLVKHSTFIATHSLNTTQLTFPPGGSHWDLLLRIPLVPAGKLTLVANHLTFEEGWRGGWVENLVIAQIISTLINKADIGSVETPCMI